MPSSPPGGHWSMSASPRAIGLGVGPAAVVAALGALRLRQERVDARRRAIAHARSPSRERREGQSRFRGDALVREAPAPQQHACAQAGVLAQRPRDALAGERAHVGQRRGRERGGACARHGGGHVGHAVVHDALGDEGRLGERGGARGLGDAARVDARCPRSPRPRFMRATSERGRSLGVGVPGMKTAPTTRSAASAWRSTASGVARPASTAGPSRAARASRVAAERVRIVTFAPMAAATSAAFVPAWPPPSTRTRAGSAPGQPASSVPLPPAGQREEVRPDLDRQPPGDHRHGREEREAARGVAHHLVGDGGDAARGHFARELPARPRGAGRRRASSPARARPIRRAGSPSPSPRARRPRPRPAPRLARRRRGMPRRPRRCPAPAPSATRTSWPSFARTATAARSRPTRRSPSFDSRGMPIRMLAAGRGLQALSARRASAMRSGPR